MNVRCRWTVIIAEDDASIRLLPKMRILRDEHALDPFRLRRCARLFDARGHELPGVDAQIHYQLHATPDGGAELDAEALLAALAGALDQLFGQAGARAGAIGGVAISSILSPIRPRSPPQSAGGLLSAGAKAYGACTTGWHPTGATSLRARGRSHDRARR